MAQSQSIEKYEMIPHGPWILCKSMGKSYCFSCGLVRLGNHISRWAEKMGCDHVRHPQFKAQLELSVKLAQGK